MQADPAAAEARWTARNSARVEIGVMGRDGLRDIYGWLTAADATYLDAALEQLSTILAGHGSTETAAERRATALGILATPARALALIQHSLTQPTLTDAGTVMLPDPDEGPEPDDSHGPRSPFGCAGHACGRITVPTERLLPKATLIIHLSDDSLTSGVGVGRCEQLGPITINQITQLVGHSRVEVRPVFNPDGIIGVDDYEIPAPMRRAVLQRHRYEVFPYGARTTASLDLDHTKPYRWGDDLDDPAKPTPTTSDHCAASRTARKPTPAGAWPNPNPAPSPGPARSAAATSSPPPDSPTTTNTPPAPNPGTTPSADHSCPTHQQPVHAGNGPAPQATDPPGRPVRDPNSDSGPRPCHGQLLDGRTSNSFGHHRTKPDRFQPGTGPLACPLQPQSARDGRAP